MLATYLADTRLLLNDAAGAIYSDNNLTGYINRARSYVATLGECVRDLGSASVTTNNTQIAYTSFSPTLINTASKMINPRNLWIEGGAMIEMRSYEWWTAYDRAYTIPAGSVVASIYAQGNQSTSASGNIFVRSGASISLPFTMVADAIWLPIPLVDDSTTENIPTLWTETVCYYAAYLAYMQVQRHADAGEMLQRFATQMSWARRATTPSQQTPTNATLGGPGTQQAAAYGSLVAPSQGGRG